MVAGVVQNPEFDWCYRGELDPSIGGRPDAADARGALQVFKLAFGRRGALTTGYWD